MKNEQAKQLENCKENIWVRMLSTGYQQLTIRRCLGEDMKTGGGGGGAVSAMEQGSH